MKRTLLAIGIAILASMMAVPIGFWWSDDRGNRGYNIKMLAPFFFDPAEILWRPFILQTVFAAVLFAVIVNLLPRRK